MEKNAPKGVTMFIGEIGYGGIGGGENSWWREAPRWEGVALLTKAWREEKGPIGNL